MENVCQYLEIGFFFFLTCERQQVHPPFQVVPQISLWALWKTHGCPSVCPSVSLEFGWGAVVYLKERLKPGASNSV